MRSLDLVGAEVRNERGERLGVVHDLLLQSGAPPLPDSSEPAFAISKLVVGPSGVGHRLGYGRGEMNGPWPLTLILKRLAARSREIPWSDVLECASRTITVRTNGTADTPEETS